jgi:hypothetical protein
MSGLNFTLQCVYSSLPIMAMRKGIMVKKSPLTFDDLSEALSYDPDTGNFFWKKTVSTKMKAGSRAGVKQRMQNGKDYWSITYRGRKLSGAQLAWLLQTGEWPDRSVFFIDEDPTNLRFSNLKLAEHKAVRIQQEDGSVKYKMSAEQARHYGLVRYYNIGLTEYAQMFADQGGVCGICKKPEAAKLPGRKTGLTESRVRDLSVDHCHKTGKIRELLCNSCNHILGEAKDDPQVLRAAADYLDKHNAGGALPA